MFRNIHLKQRIVRFRQIYPDHRTARDNALGFAEIAKVTERCEGQSVTVLQLTASKSSEGMIAKQESIIALA